MKPFFFFDGDSAKKKLQQKISEIIMFRNVFNEYLTIASTRRDIFIVLFCDKMKTLRQNNHYYCMAGKQAAAPKNLDKI